MSNLSKAYGEIPVKLQDIIPLDFHKNIESLPKSHEWEIVQSIEHDQIIPPVIDLTDPNAKELVAHASKTWGMFQVTNHGIPSSLLDTVESEARKLFALPTQQKLKVLRSSDGSTGYGSARISPFSSKFMWYEGFTIMGSSLVHAKQLWPHDYSDFCDVMDDCQTTMRKLAHQLLFLILKPVANDPSEEEEINKWAASIYEAGEGEGALQLNSYPSCPDPSRAMGLAPHTDSLLLTILNQSDTSGLQIFRDGIGWITVPPVPGALVIIVGDLLHVFSNGKFPNAYHRVMVNQNKHRISVAFFYGPPVDFQLAPLPKFELPLYRSMSVKDYIGIKAKHNDKALSFIKV